MRIDTYISEKYSFSRNKVQQFIKSGLILKNGEKIKKFSENFSESDDIKILDDRRVRWVSRSAEKLAGFLEKYKKFSGKILNAKCLDVGASTGGFTQVLIENNAFLVDSVELWSGQLAENLKNHKKIFSYENTDIRDFQSQNAPYDVVVCDASFISLSEILDSIISFSDKNTLLLLLLKPQFEVTKNLLTKSGIPKNEKIITEILEKFRKIFDEKNLKILEEEKSSLLGEAGNQEYIFALQEK